MSASTNERTIPRADLPEVLTVAELAAFLRFAPKKLYEALARNQIPGARRMGHEYRISRDAVLAWLDGQGCDPRSPRSKR